MGLGPRLLEKYGNIDSDMPRIAGVVWGNIGMLVAFVGLFTSAIVYRRTPEIHKRLMSLACICISLPALARVSRFPLIDVPEPPFAFVGLMVMLVSLFVYDKVATGRVHRVTIIGSVGLLASLIAFSVMFPQTQFGQRFVLLFQ
jgi:hypothetical protein